MTESDSDDTQASDEPRWTPADTPLLLDAMLGKLATYLRMCGYDAAYALDRGVEADDALLELTRAEDRLLVTRDSELASRAGGIYIHSLDVTDQLAELADGGFTLELTEPARCAECNGELAVVERGETPDYAPEIGDVETGDAEVWRCPDCGQYFWKGSHWESVEKTLAEL